MWMVAKIKIQEIKIFKEKLVEKFGEEITFYCPKIVFSKYFKSSVNFDLFHFNFLLPTAFSKSFSKHSNDNPKCPFAFIMIKSENTIVILVKI